MALAEPPCPSHPRPVVRTRVATEVDHVRDVIVRAYQPIVVEPRSLLSIFA